MLVNDFLLNKTLINRVGFCNLPILQSMLCTQILFVYDHSLMILAISHLLKMIGFPISLYTSNEYNVKKI